MKIGVLGGNGFVGNSIVKILNEHLVTNISRENYNEYKNEDFDIFINSNGNSHKYWGNLNPLEDFNKSVVSVYNSIYDFNYKRYIYISSIDAEITKTSYGLHKYLAEQLVKFHCDKYSIIRIPGIIGKDASKGVIYDIKNKNKIFLTPDSTMMLMDVESVAINLKKLIKKRFRKIEKFYPEENIAVEEIGKFLDLPIKYGNELRSEYFDYKGTYDKSINYLKRI